VATQSRVPTIRSLNQILTAYEATANVTRWRPALNRHQAIFDRISPATIVEFSSTTNEQAARVLGVRRVVLPRPEISHAARARTPPQIPSGTID
jgi:hypothetical protein